MSAARCPTCDREGTNCPTWDTLIRGTLPDSEVRHIALAAMRDCRAHAVDWRARCLAREEATDAAYRAGRDAFDVPAANGEPHVDPQTANPHPDGDPLRTWWSRGYQSAARLFYGACDRIAREATRRLAAVGEAVEAARKRLGKLVDHFEAMDGEEDSSQLAYDLQAISDGLRAAMEKQP